MIIINIVILLIPVFSLIFSSCNDRTFNLQRSKLLKAILPYGIIIGHISAYNTNVFNVAIIGRFIVGVFFFVSAYGLESKRQSGGIAICGLWGRLWKLMVPLIVPIIIYIAVLLIKGQDAWSVLLENLKNYQLLLPFTWFVIILAIFYVFFYALSSICKFSDKRFLLLLTLCVCVFSIANFIIFRDTAAYTNFSSLCFPAGVLYRQYESKIVPFLRNKLCYILCFLILLTIGFMSSVNYLLPVTILIWSTTIIMLSTLFSVKECRTLNFFSKISYEVYVCQGIAYLYIPQHFDKYPPVVHILLTIALTMTIAVVCYFVTSQIKRLVSAR